MGEGGHMLSPPPLIYVSSGGVMCPQALIALLIWKLADGGEYFSINGSIVIEQKIGGRMKSLIILDPTGHYGLRSKLINAQNPMQTIPP